MSVFHKSIYVVLAVFCLAVGASGAARAEPIGGYETEPVDLDHFINTQRPVMDGTRTILPPRRVSFAAVLKSQPEQIKVEYLFEALSLMQVNPLPKVSFRVFVESPEGSIVPMYVEDAAAAAIQSRVATDSRADFSGYHVYNYSKGPAVVIDTVK